MPVLMQYKGTVFILILMFRFLQVK